ncbi:hypothetical protein [Gluconobacter kondonii]|uniref:Transposase n=1 Tax=Gluconobacter kondonii TaxID=941463 RepID=A0ABQ5WSW9_9PROT|nr:hypothetical protein [Gluconobacter kondonii]GLQ65737.1 hypothetical protein GCM10007870_13210 [Gluconobacter kondonii]
MQGNHAKTSSNIGQETLVAIAIAQNNILRAGPLDSVGEEENYRSTVGL